MNPCCEIPMDVSCTCKHMSSSSAYLRICGGEGAEMHREPPCKGFRGPDGCVFCVQKNGRGAGPPGWQRAIPGVQTVENLWARSETRYSPRGCRARVSTASSRTEVKRSVLVSAAGAGSGSPLTVALAETRTYSGDPRVSARCRWQPELVFDLSITHDRFGS